MVTYNICILFLGPIKLRDMLYSYVFTNKKSSNLTGYILYIYICWYLTGTIWRYVLWFWLWTHWPIHINASSDAYMPRLTWHLLFQLIVCRLFSPRPLSETMMDYCELALGHISIKMQWFSFHEMHLKMSSANRKPFCLDCNVLILECYSPRYRTDHWEVVIRMIYW